MASTTAIKLVQALCTQQEKMYTDKNMEGKGCRHSSSDMVLAEEACPRSVYHYYNCHCEALTLLSQMWETPQKRRPMRHHRARRKVCPKYLVYSLTINDFSGFSAGIEAASGWRGRRLKITNGMWTTLPFHSTSAHPLLAARSAVATNTQITPIQDEIVAAIDARIQAMGMRIEAEISDLKVCIEERSASVATLERTQQELKNMLLMLCGHQAIAVASAAPSTSAISTLPVVGLSNLRAGGGSAPVPAQSSTTSNAPSKSLLIYTINYLTAQQVGLVRQHGL